MRIGGIGARREGMGGGCNGGKATKCDHHSGAVAGVGRSMELEAGRVTTTARLEGTAGILVRASNVFVTCFPFTVMLCFS